MPAPPTAAALLAAARSFPPRTAAPDGASPRHFALLSPPALDTLAGLLHAAEVFGVYGSFLEELAIRLIP